MVGSDGPQDAKLAVALLHGDDVIKLAKVVAVACNGLIVGPRCKSQFLQHLYKRSRIRIARSLPGICEVSLTAGQLAVVEANPDLVVITDLGISESDDDSPALVTV